MKIISKNAAQKVVTAWAYVNTVEGKVVYDHSGDTISIETLEKAAHGYINKGVGKIDHSGGQIATLLESMVFSLEMQQMLGMDLGQTGWLVRFKINDDDVWRDIQSGKLMDLSIGGSYESIEELHV